MPPLSLVAGGLQTLAGLGQSLFSGVKKANKNLENFANTYKPNESITDFYNKSLSRYNPNPYNSLAYQNNLNTTGRNLATGISASQDRRGGLASLGSLVAGANQSNANAAARAEQQSGADLNRLGQAAGMKTREDKVPFDLKYNLLAAKAGAAARTKANGLQNIFGGLNTVVGGMNGGNKQAEEQELLDPSGLMGTYAPRRIYG